MLDAIYPQRCLPLQLITGEGHYQAVIETVLSARCSVWIATANLKELLVRGTSRQGYRSVLEVFDQLAGQRLDLRILHAKLPSRAFRQSFDQYPRLIGGGLELRLCPRVHLKTVIVDGERCYLGSANWTGAGLGAKNKDRRNFELGMVTGDPVLIDQVQALFDHIWRGQACASCQRREICEAPLDGD